MSEDAYRAEKTASGQKFQDFVVELLFRRRGLVIMQFASKEYQYTRGESFNGVEIKHDEIYATTRHLWIEVAEKAVQRSGAYAPSGILRNDNSWLYVIGNYDELYVFAKRALVLLYESNRYKKRENERRTSEGFLLPEADAKRHAAFVEVCFDENDDRWIVEQDRRLARQAEAIPSHVVLHRSGEVRQSIGVEREPGEDG